MERETAEYDIVIVGAGPAGLSAAIRIKQLAPERSVVIIEKGSEVGSHIMSGAVLDLAGLDRLLPDWRTQNPPEMTPVTSDDLHLLTEKSSVRLPGFALPPLMHNAGCMITSLGMVCRWLGGVAEGLGVDIFPGMSASAPVFDDNGALTGVIAGESGRNHDGTAGPRYEPGMIVSGKYVLIAEGARGSLAKHLINHFDLSATSEPQKFGLGMKEVWEVDPSRHRLGQITHTLGWPLGGNAAGGSFLYHAPRNRIHLGLVIHLDYSNPHLDPYREFQRFKHHPMIRSLLEGGQRIEYGARAISEGGMQSLPRLSFPGGLLLGCSAGLVNVPRIKGIHNAMHSGIDAAEACVAAISNGRAKDDLTNYDHAIRSGVVGEDLSPVRNVKPLWKKFGLTGGVILAGIDMWFATIFRRTLLGTWRHGASDAQNTGAAKDFAPIDYPQPDGSLSFDRATNVAYASISHDDAQPDHLKLIDPNVPVMVNLPKFAEPAQRYCPAGVYEILTASDGTPRLQINAQNCVHCKTCDIKDPSQNIVWTTPEGGSGPNYSAM